MTTVYKVAAIRNLCSDNITLVNFFIAALLSVTTTVREGLFSVFGELRKADFATFTTVKSEANTAVIILIIGLLSGTIFLVNLAVMANSVANNGSSLSSFFKNSGFVGGILIAVLFFKEVPSPYQWIGIALTIIALANLIGDFKSLRVLRPELLIFMLIAGTIIEADNKFFATYALAKYKSALLAVIYIVAFVLCVCYTIFKFKKMGTPLKFTFEEVVFGCVLGLSNLYNNFFKLKSLETVNASVAFPLFASGILLITTLIGILIFKEKTSKRHIISVITAIISVALLNL